MTTYLRRRLRRLFLHSSAVCNSSGDHSSPLKTLIPPSDRHRRRILELLAADGWCTLLEQELSAGRLNLNPRSVISILQQQQSPFLLLKFYIFATSAAPSLSKNFSLIAVLRRGLVRTGPLVLSPEFLKEIRTSGLLLTEQTLCILFSSWGTLGLPKYCLDVFGQVSFLGIIPSTKLHNSAIKALVSSNCIDLAYLQFQRMPSDSCTPDRFTFNTLIHGVCSAGVMPEALRLLRRMESSGVSPNSYTFAILIHGFCNSDMIDSAFEILDTMKNRGIAATEVHFGTLIRGIFRRVTPGAAAFRRVSALLDGDAVAPRVLPSFCDVMLSSLSEKHMVEEIVFFLKKAEELGYVLGCATFNIVMTCFVKNGFDPAKTCAVFDLFTARGGVPGFSTYLALVEMLFRSERAAEGERYLTEMVENGFLPNVFSYNMVVDCFRRLGMVDRGSKVVEEMEKRGVRPNSVTFNTLISGFCRAGDTDKAREMLILLLERGLDPDVFTFTSIIDGLCRARCLKQAFQCHTEMERWGVRPNWVTYNVLVKSFCDAGDVRKASKLFEKMKNDGVEPNVYTFNAMIEGLGRAGEVEEARRLFDSMVCVGVDRDNYTYCALIEALCGVGRIEEAEEVFRSMEGNGCVPDVYITSLIEDALAGRFNSRRKS